MIPCLPQCRFSPTCAISLWTLQWRHNERDSVPNHQPHDCWLKLLSRDRWKRTSKLRVTGPLCGEFTGYMLPFDDVIMWIMWNSKDKLNFFNIQCVKGVHNHSSRKVRIIIKIRKVSINVDTVRVIFIWYHMPIDRAITEGTNIVIIAVRMAPAIAKTH